jgi:poly(3-hydroxybutyrate) depolymerase
MAHQHRRPSSRPRRVQRYSSAVRGLVALRLQMPGRLPTVVSAALLLAVGSHAMGGGGGGDTRELIMPDGDVRSYILTLPPNHDPEEGSAAVLDFHGAGSNPQSQLAYSNLTPLATRDRVILVHPNSRSSMNNKVWWHGTLYLPEDDADIRFIYELVRVLAEEHGATSFYAMGMSSGGDISSGLACQPDSPFSGFGAVTHAYYWGTNPPGSGSPGSPFYNGGSPENTGQQSSPCMLNAPPDSFATGEPTTHNCAHGQPRRYIYFHGTEDSVCPYLGDCSCWKEPPREECAHRWGRHNLCTTGTGYDWTEEQVSQTGARLN